MKPHVTIFRDRLLYPSELFIVDQAAGVKDFEVRLICSRRVPGSACAVALDVVNTGGAAGVFRELLFKSGVPVGTMGGAHDRTVLVHAHFGPDGALALPLARKARVPLLVTFHGYDVTVRPELLAARSLTNKLYVRRRRSLGRSAAVLIAVSEFIATCLRRQGFPAEKIKVHYIGVDTDFFTPRGQTKRGPNVLFVGRLVEKKGCEYLLRAMAAVQARQPDASVTVVGDGPLRQHLEGVAAALRVRCSFVGYQSREAIRDRLEQARVFCVPSITADDGDAEGFGLVFAEAQAMGVPCIATQSGGIPEAVADGVTGILVPERDAGGLARGITSLLTDDTLWTRYSAAARARAVKLFDLRVQTAKLEHIYGQVSTSA